MEESAKLNETKYNFKIYYPKKHIRMYYILGILSISLFGGLFLCLWLFPKEGVKPRSVSEEIGYLLMMFACLLYFFIINFIPIIYCKKTTVDVTYNTIYYRTLFFEKEFMFDDITYIKSYLDGHQNNGFTKRYHLTMAIYVGKKKMKINTRMVNATKLWDLLIERGYLEKELD